MELVTATEMREIDRRAVEAYGIPVLVLMEQAGFFVARAAAVMLGRVDGAAGGVPGRVLVLAGKGNNGGDGLAAARYLHQWGIGVQVALLARPEDLGPAPAENWRWLGRIGVPARALEEPDAALRAAAGEADLIVDALLGTGLRGPAGGPLAEAIAVINEAGRPVLAVDIPSGLDADTGVPAGGGPCVRAAATVTMCRPKLGMLLHPGALYCGAIAVAPIPIPEAAVRAEAAGAALLTRDAVRGMLPPRPPEGHKGTFGHVLVIGGAHGYTGAPALAALGALRGGAGLVTVACPVGIATSLAAGLNEVMVRPLSGDPDYLTVDAWPELAPLSEAADAICAGPGLGRRPETAGLLRELLKAVDKPLVLDADGLNLLDLDILADYPGPLVLTPHPGEMGRLLGTSAEEVQDGRPGAARTALARAAARGRPRACVLKGARSLVAGGGGPLLVNPTGSTALATAGTGDVLAGLVAALLAQGCAPAEAAAAGTYVHGLAGELAGEAWSERAVIAGDVLALLGAAFRRVEAAGPDPRSNADFPLIWLNRAPRQEEPPPPVGSAVRG